MLERYLYYLQEVQVRKQKIFWSLFNSKFSLHTILMHVVKDDDFQILGHKQLDEGSQTKINPISRLFLYLISNLTKFISKLSLTYMTTFNPTLKQEIRSQRLDYRETKSQIGGRVIIGQKSIENDTGQHYLCNYCPKLKKLNPSPPKPLNIDIGQSISSNGSIETPDQREV